jgi:hypothetical protein
VPADGGEVKTWRAEVYVECDTTYNRQHISSEILSMSKVIMNEVTCLLEDLGCPVYYTDTDSLHVSALSVAKLQPAFFAKYGRNIIGKDMGQFHTDFEKIKDAKGEEGGEPFAIRSIFCGKKSYADLLMDERGKMHVHFRLKGIPSEVVRRHAQKHFGGDIMALYDYLYEGNPITFNMLDGSLCFRKKKNHEMFSLVCGENGETNGTTRTVHFPRKP